MKYKSIFNNYQSRNNSDKIGLGEQRLDNLFGIKTFSVLTIIVIKTIQQSYIIAEYYSEGRTKRYGIADRFFLTTKVWVLWKTHNIENLNILTRESYKALSYIHSLSQY